MNFFQWFYESGHTHRAAAESAWNHQQKRINELEQALISQIKLEKSLRIVAQARERLIEELEAQQRRVPEGEGLFGQMMELAKDLAEYGTSRTSESEVRALADKVRRLETAAWRARVDTLKWIPVSEKLPDGFLCLVPGGVARYSGKGVWLSATDNEYPGRVIEWEVTHWMPLPSPPKG